MRSATHDMRDCVVWWGHAARSEAGKQLGNERLREIGDKCERDHDRYADEANRLCQTIFVEHVRGVDFTTAAAQVDTQSGISR